MADSPADTEGAQVIFSAIRNKMSGNIPLYYRCYGMMVVTKKATRKAPAKVKWVKNAINIKCKYGKTPLKVEWSKQTAIGIIECKECKKRMIGTQGEKPGVLVIDKEIDNKKFISPYSKMITNASGYTFDSSTSAKKIKAFLQQDDGDWLMSSINLANIIAKDLSTSTSMHIYRAPNNATGIMKQVAALFGKTRKAVVVSNSMPGQKNKQTQFNDMNKWNPADIYYTTKKGLTTLTNEVARQKKDNDEFNTWDQLNIFMNNLVPKDVIPMSLKKAPIGNSAIVKKINVKTKGDDTVTKIIKNKTVGYHGFQWTIKDSIFSNKNFIIKATPSAQVLQFRDKAGKGTAEKPKARSFQYVVTGGKFAFDGSVASSLFSHIISDLAKADWGLKLTDSKVSDIVRQAETSSKGMNDALVKDWQKYKNVKTFKGFTSKDYKAKKPISYKDDMTNFFVKDNLTNYLNFCKTNSLCKKVFTANNKYGNAGTSQNFWIEMLTYSLTTNSVLPLGKTGTNMHWFGKSSALEVHTAMVNRQQFLYIKYFGGFILDHFETHKSKTVNPIGLSKAGSSNRVVQELAMFAGSKGADVCRHYKGSDKSQL